MKISKSTLFASIFAVAASGNFPNPLSAIVIQVDFNGMDILASDLAPYVDMFNLQQEICSGNLSEELKDKMAKCRKEVEAKKSDYQGMTFKEFAGTVKDALERLSEDEEDIKSYMNETVETILEADNFADSIFNPSREGIDKSIARGCVHNSVKEGDGSELVKFHLKNGSLSGKEAQKLLKGLQRPFLLFLEDVKGTLMQNETVKQKVVAMMFKHCALQIGKNCFRSAENLAEVHCISSDIRLEKGAFADCRRLNPVVRKKTDLICEPPCSYAEAFEGTFNTEIITLMACDRLDSLTRIGQCKMSDLACFIQVNRLEPTSLNLCYEKLTGKLTTQVERRRSANQNLQRQMEDTARKNRALQEDLKTSLETYESLSKEYSQLASECENLKKTHAEAVEKNKKELEGKCRELNNTQKDLEKYKTSFYAGEKELKGLKEETKAQKEEIDTLKAFKTKWEQRILAFEALEAEKNKLSKQLEIAETSESNAKRMLEKERAQNKETVKEKNRIIGDLKGKLGDLTAELKKTRDLLFKAQTEIKDLKSSETHIMATVSGVLSDDEDEKEEEKNRGFHFVEPEIKKNFQNHPQKSNRKKGKGWKKFEYPKNDTK